MISDIRIPFEITTHNITPSCSSLDLLIGSVLRNNSVQSIGQTLQLNDPRLNSKTFKSAIATQRGQSLGMNAQQLEINPVESGMKNINHSGQFVLGLKSCQSKQWDPG